MESFVDKSQSKALSIAKKRRKLGLLILALVGVIVAIVAVIIFTYYYGNRNFGGYDVVSTKKRSDSNTVSYCGYQGSLMKYSRDGASALDASGNTLWNGGYEMKRPQVDICDKYVVIADVMSKQFYVYNGSDSGTRIETTLPIVKAKVSAKGVVAVLLQDQDSNTLNLYNPYSSATPLLVEVPTNVDGDGYPMDFDISPDGESLATSCLSVNHGTTDNKVSFYNFTDVGQDKNRLVAGASYGEKMISSIRFLDDDRVVVFYQNGFSVWSNMKQPAEAMKKVFTDPIKSVVSNDSYIGVILDVKSKNENHLQLFGVDGTIKLDQKIQYEYETVKLAEDELIFNSKRKCNILRCNGKEKFGFTFEQNIQGIYPTNEGNHYYLLDDINMQEIKLQG